MTADRQHPVYRALVALYPSEFRRAYGPDLIELFDEMIEDQGPLPAWRRAALDLLITIPRYRLEDTLSESHANIILTMTTAALVVAGALVLAGGAWTGLILLVVALLIAGSQRSTLARALQTPDRARRRRRLGTAAMLAVVFLGAMGSYLNDIDDDHISSTSLMVHTVVGLSAIIGSAVFLVAGLTSARTTNSAAA